MQEDMKKMHENHKSLLLEIDNNYAAIEQETHEKYRNFIEKWKAQMNKRIEKYKEAYETEKKSKESTRDWAEENITALQEKLREMKQEKKNLLEQYNTLLEGTEIQTHRSMKAMEATYSDQVEKQKSEKSKLEQDLAMVVAKTKSRTHEIARLSLEIVLCKVDSYIQNNEPQSQVPMPQVSADESLKKEISVLKSQLQESQNDKVLIVELKKENQKLKNQLERKQENEQSPEEVKTLKEQLASQQSNFSSKLQTLQSEKESLQKELQSLKTNFEANEDDDSNVQGFKSHIGFLESELSENRNTISNLESEKIRLEGIIANTQNTNQELEETKTKLSELQQKNYSLEDELADARSQIDQLNLTIQQLEASSSLRVQPTNFAGSDQKNFETEQLALENERLKTELKKAREISDDVVKPKGKDDKRKTKLRNELKKAKANIAQMQAQLDSNPELEQYKSKLQQAYQRIAELEAGQSMGGSGDSDKKLQQAYQRIAELEAASPADAQTLNQEIQKLKSENEKLKSAATLQDGNKQLEEENLKLKDQLNSRPDPQEFQELQNKFNSLQEQLNNASSSSSNKIQELTTQLNDMQSQYESKISEMQTRNTESINGLKQALVQAQTEKQEVDQKKSDLEDQLEKLEQEHSQMQIELESQRKVAGQAESLSREVSSLQANLASLQESNSMKEQELKDSIRQRKLLHNQLEDLKGKIRVFCRVRPMNRNETQMNCTNITSIVDEFTLNCESKNGQVKPFVYDSVFGPNSTQDDVFEDTRRLVQSAVDGYNVCIFAYGQTGSGKTYTIQGEPSNPGVTPRAIEDLFQILGSFPKHYTWQVSCYMIEIYMDTLIDLFLPKEQKGNSPSLSIKKDVKGMVVIPEATQHRVNSPEELYAYFQQGNTFRHTSSTKMNDTSSRSHLVFGVLIDVTNEETQQRTVGKLSLVDLAGSERVSKTDASAERLKEGRAINKSLTALGDVISALSSGETHVPYRNNKLTMLMSDSLGGTAKTLMFVNVSPADYNREETLMSLYYAARVKLIKNEPTKNLETKEMSKMKQEILSLSVERDKYKAALERNNIPLSSVNEVSPEAEDFDDERYDEL